ncbi:MAG: 30S ribosomal protein S27ae [Candidatus Aenigmatarchaeota archaeon]
MTRHAKVQKWDKYEVEGDEVKRVNDVCPRCGNGVFLADHKNRVTCGKCGYSEIKTDEGSD